jgi:hypothetical protein
MGHTQSKVHDFSNISNCIVFLTFQTWFALIRRYNEEFYTTPLPKNLSEEEKRKAEKLAAEIEAEQRRCVPVCIYMYVCMCMFLLAHVCTKNIIQLRKQEAEDLYAGV